MHIINGQNTEFASRLIRLRRKKGVTQEELAQSIDTDKRSISTYETGKVFPREATILRLASYFEVEPLWLSTGISSESSEYFENKKQKSLDAKNNGPRRLEFLFIEDLDKVNFSSKRNKHYSKEPSAGYQSNDISLFMPVLKTFFQKYRALRLPQTFEWNSLYMKNSVVIVDEVNTSIKSIPSGADVIFRFRGKENVPGLRKLIKEPGINPILVSLYKDRYINPIEINAINIEILGVVIGIQSSL